jgi:hypothetical protein
MKREWNLFRTFTTRIVCTYVGTICIRIYYDLKRSGLWSEWRYYTLTSLLYFLSNYDRAFCRRRWVGVGVSEWRDPIFQRILEEKEKESWLESARESMYIQIQTVSFYGDLPSFPVEKAPEALSHTTQHNLQRLLGWDCCFLPSLFFLLTFTFAIHSPVQTDQTIVQLVRSQEWTVPGRMFTKN